MGVQKIRKELLVASFSVVLLLFGCNPKPQKISSSSKEEICLSSIHVEVADTTLLYWIEIAGDSTNLIEHSGNSRFLISQSGRVYSSYNNKKIDNLNNYFNTELKYYKTLVPNKLQQVKDSIQQWNLSTLDAIVVNNEIRTSGAGIDRYLYTNVNKQVSCTQFGMGVSWVEKIERLLKSV